MSSSSEETASLNQVENAGAAMSGEWATFALYWYAPRTTGGMVDSDLQQVTAEQLRGEFRTIGPTLIYWIDLLDPVSPERPAPQHRG